MRARDLATGSVLDGFILGERIAAGGMGTIWRATHADVELPIVLKIPFFAPGDDVSTIVGYEVEEMIMRRLEGPHAPKFIASGDLSRVPFLAMEFIPGPTLEKRLSDTPLPPAIVAHIGAQVARALDAIHRQHVVHLDLKPANIIMAERGAVLIDFGLARHDELPDLLGEESRLPMGSAPYIAPEQILGDRSNPSSDIFALGAILYELTTGEKPFGTPTSTAGMERRIYHPPRPPRELVYSTPRWLQEIILKCLEVDPARRYATAAQVRFDLQNPEQVALSERANRASEAGVMAMVRRYLMPRPKAPPFRPRLSARYDSAPMVLAAVDLVHGMDPLAEEVRIHLRRVLATEPGARLACLSVLKSSIASLDAEVDHAGRPAYISRLVALKDWASVLDLPTERTSFHVVEAVDVAAAILDYAARNDIDQIVMGARASSAFRRHLGSVSARVVAEAACTVMVVRLKERDGTSAEEAPEALGDPTM